MTLSTTINRATETSSPTLEESAAKLGINPAEIDSSAQEQSATITPPAEKAERPANIPEKFWDAEKGEIRTEALLASYTELEKKQSTKTDVKPPETAKGEAESETTTTVEEQAQEAVDKAGLDMDALGQKYWDTGALEDKDYEALAKAGYPKDLVDQFINGQEAIRDAQRSTVFNEVGGEDAYADMVTWASENLKANEIAAYDRVVNGKDYDATLQAVKGLKARYNAEVGTEPARSVSGSVRSGAGEVYESVAQLQEDMRNPKYKSDPAFRAKVEGKLGRSDIM